MKTQTSSTDKERCKIVSEKLNQFDPRSPQTQELRIDNFVVFRSTHMSGNTDKRQRELLSLIVRAVNEHAALVAVAEAGQWKYKISGVHTWGSPRPSRLSSRQLTPSREYAPQPSPPLQLASFGATYSQHNRLAWGKFNHMKQHYTKIFGYDWQDISDRQQGTYKPKLVTSKFSLEQTYSDIEKFKIDVHQSIKLEYAIALPDGYKLVGEVWKFQP